VPFDRIGERPIVRLSVQAYKSDDDCEALLSALGTLQSL
jgi:hypothetical protein